MKTKPKRYELSIDTPDRIFTEYTLRPEERILQIKNSGYFDVEEGGTTHVIPYHAITSFEFKE